MRSVAILILILGVGMGLIVFGILKFIDWRYDGLETQITGQQSEFDRLNPKIDSQSERIDGQKAQIEELTSGIDSQKAQLGELTSGIDSQKAQLEELVSGIDSQKAQLEEFVSGIDSQKAQLEELVSKTENQNRELASLTSLLTTKELTTARYMNELLLLAGPARLEGEAKLAEDYLVNIALTQKNKSHRVVPIYFVPSGIEPNQNMLPQINRNIALIQAWYMSRVGKTFEWDTAIMINDPNPIVKHGIDDDLVVWDWVFRELNTLLPQQGYPPIWDSRVYVVFVAGWNNTTSWGAGGENGGLAILGQQPIKVMDYSADGVYANERYVYDGELRHAAHEMGHTFGLGHPSVDDLNFNFSIMGNGSFLGG